MPKRDPIGSSAAHFARYTSCHELTVLRDDGLYRHLSAQSPTTYSARFEVITWPGSVAVRGDLGGGGRMFTCTSDMFELFRGHMSFDYWAEKLSSGRALVYSPERFAERVWTAVREQGHARRGLAREVQAEIFEDGYDQCERTARHMIEHFEFGGFRFRGAWEWDLDDWDPWFLFACRAVVWAVEKYDALPRVEINIGPSCTGAPGASEPAIVRAPRPCHRCGHTLDKCTYCGAQTPRPVSVHMPPVADAHPIIGLARGVGRPQKYS